MEKREQIPAGQFFALLFVSRAAMGMGLNTAYLGGTDLLKATLSVGLAMTVQLPLCLPICRLRRRFPDRDMAQAAVDLLGRRGKLIPAGVLLYYVLADGAVLGLFALFLRDTVSPEYSVLLVLAVMAGAAAIGAWRGLEGLSRCALLLLAALLLGSGLLFALCLPRFRLENLPPLTGGGWAQVPYGAAMLLPRTAVFGELLLLLPQVNGKIRRGWLLWSQGLGLFLSLLLVLLAGCLGPFAALREFPVFTLAGITEVRALQRVDAVLVGLWMTGLILKLAEELILCLRCLSALRGRPVRGLSGALPPGLAMLGLGAAVAAAPALQRVLLNLWFLLAGTLLTGVGFPLWLLRRTGKARPRRAAALRVTAVLLCAALLVPLCGCGGRELYERLLIHGIGVDRTADGVRVSVRASSSPEQEEFFTCEGETVPAALDSLALSTGRKPFYAQNYLAVFGRACAEEGLNAPLDFFIRYFNTRPAVQVYLAENTAEAVLAFQRDGEYLKMAQLQQLAAGSAETGLAVQTQVLDLVNAMRRPGSAALLPVLHTDEEAVFVRGTAYLRGDRLAGVLSPEETRGLLLLRGELSRGEAVVEGAAFGRATVSLERFSRRISVRADGDGAVFTVELRGSGELSALETPQDPAALWPELEEALARQLEQDARAVLDRALFQDGCDVAGLGNLLYRKDPAAWAALAEAWPAGAAVRLSAEISLSRVEG